LPLIVVADCVWIVAGIYPGVILELPDKKLKVFLFELLSHGGSSNTSASCSVKYLCRYKSFIDPIFVVDFARVLADIISCFHCGS
jgi:hypothetical protein